MDFLSIVQVMDFTSENPLSSRAVGVHCVWYREHIVLATSVLNGGKTNFRSIDDESSGILLRPLEVTLWRKMHEVLFTQAMTDGTKITSVWVSQKQKFIYYPKLPTPLWSDLLAMNNGYPKIIHHLEHIKSSWLSGVLLCYNFSKPQTAQTACGFECWHN